MFDQVFPNEWQKLICYAKALNNRHVILQPLLKRAKQPVLSGVGTKAFWSQRVNQRCHPLPWISKQLCGRPARSLRFLPVSLCSSYVYCIQHIQVNKAASIFLFVDMHVIVLNWVWQNKNGNLSSPKTCWFSADVFIGRNDRDCTETITNATRMRIFYCCFVFLYSFDRRLVGAAVTVWTVMGGNCCPSPFLFPRISFDTVGVVLFRTVTKTTSQFC